ncbi:hypothetical protein ABT354_35740 [Streptomyces sp. NPDC000594]|uniref:hypothetical protein n=1 Tax=Streptomyces sp. NPDC000594 TaxID=3154261 RepID=UPI00332598BC
MPRRIVAVLAGLALSAFLIGAAAQLAKMAGPERATRAAFEHKRISDVAPILIGGFLIGAAAQSVQDAPAEGSSGHTVLAMNKAELVG